MSMLLLTYQPGELGIPAFLLRTREQRCAAWERNPPQPMPTFDAPHRDEDPETAKLREEMEAQRAQRTRERIAKLKANLQARPR
jgi:hypothetical protein